ncbi:hypothetical protein BCR36DRAFT_370077 [Piromyces finnis]|uniref:Uncharacterized protein n=1 Tax=Piromyces finnis TaxID=1754191 RepID=A0A1Y1VAE1_9FUNG|nr:hypothetical protein BCR36DRAFT_370077 [Piromyces finnis]|eukprot:ORX51127.1 hypothetical protein BCR36DRAFT_370077 [Piromyces finnis]
MEQGNAKHQAFEKEVLELQTKMEKLIEQQNYLMRDNQFFKNRTPSTTYQSSISNKILNNLSTESNQFNACFSNEEEKHDYFDSRFKRNKFKNESEEDFRERFSNLTEKTKPDLRNGSRNEQYYYYKNHPRIFNSKLQATVPFHPTEFEDLPTSNSTAASGFRSLFKTRPPLYTTKDKGYEFLADLKAYLQTYTPQVNEAQIRDAILEKGAERSSNDYKSIDWNETTTWKKLNMFTYQFEREFCELSIEEQEEKWKNLKLTNSIYEENFEKFMEQIEKIGGNLNKTYFSRFIKLSKNLPNGINERCLEKLPQLPIYNPKDDFDEQNNFNQNIYEKYINILFKYIAEVERKRNFKEDIKIFISNNRINQPIRTLNQNKNTNHLRVKSEKPKPQIIRKFEPKAPNKHVNQNHITEENIIDENIKDKTQFTSGEIHNTIEKIKGSKYLNNPRSEEGCTTIKR